MVHEAKLSTVLREFAHNLATDFPAAAILDHLVDRIAETLPITAAGVTLISDGTAPHYVAASDKSALRFENCPKMSALRRQPATACVRSLARKKLISI